MTKQVRRIIHVKVKLCNTAVVMWFMTLIMAVITIQDPKYWPLLIFSLAVLILTVIPAYYLETVELT